MPAGSLQSAGTTINTTNQTCIISSADVRHSQNRKPTRNPRRAEYSNSPLERGALSVRGTSAIKAGCVFPLIRLIRRRSTQPEREIYSKPTSCRIFQFPSREGWLRADPPRRMRLGDGVCLCPYIDSSADGPYIDGCGRSFNRR